MNRNVKKLLMLSVLGLSTSLVACENAGDLTGPAHQAPTTASANVIGFEVLIGDTTELAGDSTVVEIEGLMSAPAPDPTDPKSGYGLGWP
jgi:hypothetical protein